MRSLLLGGLLPLCLLLNTAEAEKVGGGPPPILLKNKVSHHGITWFFDDYYPVGRYVMGDWWVRGPVTITAITPVTGASGEWGIDHWQDVRAGNLPPSDNALWLPGSPVPNCGFTGNSYRVCCTANTWWGQNLASRFMGIQNEILRPEFYHYSVRPRRVACPATVRWRR